MIKRKNIFLKAALLLFIIAALSVGTFIFAKDDKPQRDDIYEQIELFANTVSIIRGDYVEEVKSKDLVYGALKGMLMSLDSHSQFLNPEDYKEMKVETEGKFGGLGIEITIKDGILTIISPIEGTPAFKAGLKPNDKVVRIDGNTTKDITLTEAVKKLRGDPDTPVTLTILREEERKVLDFTIMRGIIEIKSIKEASLLEDKIGYIRLVEFQENTPKDLAKGLATLKSKGMTGLILDLRNNPGGLLEVSAKVSEMFLPQGKLIVSTKGRVKNQDMVYKSSYSRPYLNFPFVLLVNEGSASASEIVAGAIRDNKRGIIVGTTTFGKGSVQTVIPLTDGSAVRLTTATYFTPSGKAINNVGIVPDVVVPMMREVEVKADRRQEEKKEEIKEVFEGDGIKEKPKAEEAEPRTYDNQLKSAIDLIKGIKTYEALKK